ncbi:MAG: NAD-dependent epimerase/dehydratase family protein [Bacteriovoracaceae bacterium]|nr:NAD-dependent epimerase/dehydratase family protein [Bacteriovoracaceae bacterium]
MRILVTGGGGFLGTWIIKELLRKYPTAMVTNFSRHAYEHLEAMAVPTIRGDISKIEDVERALAQGFEAIFHVASLVGMWGKAESFDRINVLGTENLLSASKKFGVKRFIYTGSPSSVFGRGGHAGADETLPYPQIHLGHYARTKALAEQLVLAANDENLHTVSLRPHLIWGPGDQHLIPRVMNQARVGKLKIVGSGDNQVDVIYVEEAAKAHVLAFEKLTTGSPVCGQAYFLGQGPIRLWDFVQEILRRGEIDPPESSVNLKLAYFMGWIFEKIWILAGIYSPEPPVTRFVALNMGVDHWFSHEKAKRDLGWNPEISIEEGMNRLFAKREGYRHLLTPSEISLNQK